MIGVVFMVVVAVLGLVSAGFFFVAHAPFLGLLILAMVAFGLGSISDGLL